MIDVMQQVKHETGAKVYLFCFGPQETDFYNARNESGLFERVIDAEVLLSSSRQTGLDEKSVVERASKIESTLPRNYNSVVMSNRHLGRGYSQGGFYHPRSRYSVETDYLKVLHAYSETFEFWENQFTDLEVDLVVNGTVEAAVIAKKLGIAFRTIASSRYKNLHYWAANEFYEDARLAPAFEAAQAIESDVSSDIDVEPYFAHMVNRAGFVEKGSSLTAMLQNIVLQVARHAYWRLRRYEKARSYYLSSEIAYYYRVWSHFRRLQRMSAPLESLKGKQFVFFPLHLEPEIALQGLSPEYFFQLTTIAAISRDLPAGVYLAVKETYAGVGRRPDNFYDQIKELKNVVLLDTLEFGVDIVRQAAAVVTINGTAGLEAALEGKPAIVFGLHNNYACLPHVHVASDIHDLRPLLRHCLGERNNTQQFQTAARRYLEVVIDHSFDLRGYDFRRMEAFEASVPKDASTALLESLTSAASPPSVKATLSGAP